jgi:protein-tyrosine-phosphatase
MLFVCHGNIIRSPMAAALLSQRLAELCPAIAVKSAGFHAEPGRPADPRALALAGEFGVSLDDHRATKISADLVEQAGAIFLMDGLNRAELVSRYPEAASKAFMLGAWLDERRLPGLEIADPYDGDDTDILRCYELLESAIRNLTFDLFPGTFDKSGEPA